jgi:iron-sulfur cluster assembly protein
MITLTDIAVKQVKQIIAEMKNEQEYLRVGVKGGGCSGFQYSLALDEKYDKDKDTLIEQDGVKIVVDKRSALYLNGTQIDFHDEMLKKGFVFSNPNAVGKCGCGSSFSV